MRRDFDYVTMEDHANAMLELGARASEVIEAVKRDQTGAQRALIAAVVVSGGKIEISDNVMHRVYDKELIMWRNEADKTLILTVR